MTDKICGRDYHQDEACCHDLHCDACGKHPHQHLDLWEKWPMSRLNDFLFDVTFWPRRFRYGLECRKWRHIPWLHVVKHIINPYWQSI